MNNMKRMRGRNHRGGSSGGGGGGGAPIRHQGGGVPLNRNHVFDSSGPDLRVRGTAQQLFERYLQLGRDATGSGDRVMAESYFQHAEHYFRILNAMAQAQQGPQQGPQQGSQQGLQQGQQYQNGQHSSRRGPMQENGAGDGDEPDGLPYGMGDQPGGEGNAGESGEARHIPIAAAPPED